jgi:hypothetical protein
LPLLGIAFPMLKHRPKPQLEFLLQLVRRLIEADGNVDLREFCYYRILSSQLRQAMLPGERKRATRTARQSVRQSAVNLIRILAEQGNSPGEATERAYDAGIATFGDWAKNTVPERDPDTRVATLDDSLDALSTLNSRGRQRVIEAVSRCISQDGRLTLTEAELLRAVCASLDCPLPPVLAAAPPDLPAELPTGFATGGEPGA